MLTRLEMSYLVVLLNSSFTTRLRVRLWFACCSHETTQFTMMKKTEHSLLWSDALVTLYDITPCVLSWIHCSPIVNVIYIYIYILTIFRFFLQVKVAKWLHSLLLMEEWPQCEPVEQNQKSNTIRNFVHLLETGIVTYRGKCCVIGADQLLCIVLVGKRLFMIE